MQIKNVNTTELKQFIASVEHIRKSILGHFSENGGNEEVNQMFGKSLALFEKLKFRLNEVLEERYKNEKV